MRSILRIKIIVLAPSAPIVLIRGRDLQDLDASLLDEAEEAGSIAAGRFNADVRISRIVSSRFTRW